MYKVYDRVLDMGGQNKQHRLSFINRISGNTVCHARSRQCLRSYYFALKTFVATKLFFATNSFQSFVKFCHALSVPKGIIIYCFIAQP